MHGPMRVVAISTVATVSAVDTLVGRLSAAMRVIGSVRLVRAMRTVRLVSRGVLGTVRLAPERLHVRCDTTGS